MNSIEIDDQLRRLELALQQPSVRGDAAALDRLLHPDFSEFGRSGRSYTRPAILEQLLAEPTSANASWSQDFTLQALAEDVMSLTYRSAQVQANGELARHTLRSSIWQHGESGWQLRFHQGTPTEPFTR